MSSGGEGVCSAIARTMPARFQAERRGEAAAGAVVARAIVDQRPAGPLLDPHGDARLRRALGAR